MKKTIHSKLQLLECTLRDGSYAVDFRFTNEDTALLCKALSSIGFKFIEIGHGFGINASNAGKGRMPSSDRKLLEIAKVSARGARIGMFCIPHIATLESLEEVASAGLDFVRIGNSAEEIEEAYPYIEVARKHGLYTMLNFMKSYAIPPGEFAQKAKEAIEVGAEVIYLVDSSGGMLPEEVAGYIKAVKDTVDTQIGFHGHNNLCLATANAVQAIKSGATFVDTTLYGIGRSAGNVPTEAMLAILHNMGINLDIDLFELMEIGDAYLLPLKSRIQMHDMLSVAMGAGKFHSSFFPRVQKVAQQYRVDVKKLVYLMGKNNSARLDEEVLKKTAEGLVAATGHKTAYDITSFYSPKISKDHIANTLESVVDLMEALENASAKGIRKIVIELAATTEQDENLVLTEHVCTSENSVMGRIYFGSIAMLESILDIIKNHLSLLLVDTPSGESWIKNSQILTLIEKYIKRDLVMCIKSSEVRQVYLYDLIKTAASRYGSRAILLYGGGAEFYTLIKMCTETFDTVYLFHPQEEIFPHPQFSKLVILKNWNDWQNLDLHFDIILLLAKPQKRESKVFLRTLSEKGKILLFGSMSDSETELPQERLIASDISQAYADAIPRWLNLSAAMKD